MDGDVSCSKGITVVPNKYHVVAPVNVRQACPLPGRLHSLDRLSGCHLWPRSSSHHKQESSLIHKMHIPAYACVLCLSIKPIGFLHFQEITQFFGSSVKFRYSRSTELPKCCISVKSNSSSWARYLRFSRFC